MAYPKGKYKGQQPHRQYKPNQRYCQNKHCRRGPLPPGRIWKGRCSTCGQYYRINQRERPEWLVNRRKHGHPEERTTC